MSNFFDVGWLVFKLRIYTYRLHKQLVSSCNAVLLLKYLKICAKDCSKTKRIFLIFCLKYHDVSIRFSVFRSVILRFNMFLFLSTQTLLAQPFRAEWLCTTEFIAQQFYILPTEFVRFVWTSEQTMITPNFKGQTT